MPLIANGSWVFATTLDISKPLTVLTILSYNSMLSTDIPEYIVNVIYNWYSKLLASVRWNDGLSTSFPVGSGVRQGGALSPAIFNVFMNLFIRNLKTLGYGCCINNYYIGCFLYADDIILLSPSVVGLQKIVRFLPCYLPWTPNAIQCKQIALYYIWLLL